MQQKIVEEIVEQDFKMTPIPIDVIIDRVIKKVGELTITKYGDKYCIYGHCQGTSVRETIETNSFEEAVQSLEYETGVGD